MSFHETWIISCYKKATSSLYKKTASWGRQLYYFIASVTARKLHFTCDHHQQINHLYILKYVDYVALWRQTSDLRRAHQSCAGWHNSQYPVVHILFGQWSMFNVNKSSIYQSKYIYLNRFISDQNCEQCLKKHYHISTHKFPNWTKYWFIAHGMESSRQDYSKIQEVGSVISYIRLVTK